MLHSEIRVPGFSNFNFYKMNTGFFDKNGVAIKAGDSIKNSEPYTVKKKKGGWFAVPKRTGHLLFPLERIAHLIEVE